MGVGPDPLAPPLHMHARSSATHTLLYRAHTAPLLYHAEDHTSLPFLCGTGADTGHRDLAAMRLTSVARPHLGPQGVGEGSGRRWRPQTLDGGPKEASRVGQESCGSVGRSDDGTKP